MYCHSPVSHCTLNMHIDEGKTTSLITPVFFLSLSHNFYNLFTIADSISAFFGRETASCPVIDEQCILKNYSYHFLLIPLNISVIYCGYRGCDLKPTEAGLFYTYTQRRIFPTPNPPSVAAVCSTDTTVLVTHSLRRLCKQEGTPTLSGDAQPYVTAVCYLAARPAIDPARRAEEGVGDTATDR